ncbi:MAG: hypothetical protein HQ555_02125 [Candidatus Aminicenantes bacterium]|nr:hypothetical protein [Candidatus Aminicenantes bacterium]
MKLYIQSHRQLKRIILILMSYLTFASFTYLNAQWARTYGGGSLDYATSIQQTSDGGYIVAGYTLSFSTEFGETSYIWILKLYSSGEIEWQRAYGESNRNSRAHSIQQTLDGGYIVAGAIAPNDIIWGKNFLILKLSSSGEIEWLWSYKGRDYDWAYSIFQTSEGGYIVAGYLGYDDYWWELLICNFWILKLNSIGEIEWQRTYDAGGYERAYSIQQTLDGGYIVAGETTFSHDFWILKLSSVGHIEWQRTYGGSNFDVAKSIQQTFDGGYIVAGRTLSFGAGDNDFWILKLSTNGEIEWQKTYGGIDNDYPKSIQQTNDGGYIVAGSTSSFGAGDNDFWVLKLSPNGEIEWQRTYGGSNPDGAFSIQQTNDGGYIVAGNSSSFIFPPFPYQSDNKTDILILKLSSNGDIVSSCDFIGSSNAVISDTDITPQNTEITPQDTDISPQDTYIIPQITNAKIINLCAKFNLTIFATHGGTTNPSPDSYTCYSGTEAQIEAIPESGYEFNKWNWDTSGSDNPTTITMDSDKSIIAYFYPVLREEDDSLFEFPCFIATAAYGSTLNPYVKILREFRDRYLMPSRLGRELVGIYYKYSPFAAELIAKHKVLKVAVRNNLVPIIAFSYSMVHLGPIITAILFVLILTTLIFSISFYLRKLM